MRRFLALLVALVVFGAISALGQARQVTGKVVSADGKQPIPGVNVFVKEAPSVGITTNIDGEYKLTGIPQNAKTIVFSFIGFQKLEMPISPQISVSLTPDSQQLEEVVVTGYGVVKKAAFTGAAARVDNKTIDRYTDADVMKALQSNVPGLQMNVTSGQPGASNSVYIRGIGSYNSGTQPLYVVDGVPITTGRFGMREGESQTVNPLANINSADIESVTVLKDATATSIYGARAANGVIVITTKKGKEGKAAINFNARFGTAVSPGLGDYKMLGSKDYIEFVSTGFVNKTGFLTENGYPETMAGARQLMEDNDIIQQPDDVSTNWYDEVTRTGVVQDYNLDISGGTDAIKYYIGGGYYDEKGFVIGKDLKRYSGRVNLESKVRPILTLGVNLTAAYSEMNSGAGGGYYSDPITQALMQQPTMPVRKADGTWNFDTWNGYNPVAQRSEYGDKSFAQQYKAIVSPWMKLDLTKNLFFMSRYGMDYYNLKEFGRWSMLQPQGKDMNMMGEEGNNYRTMWTWTNTITYMKTFKELHNVNILLGQEAQKTNNTESYLAASNFPTDIVFSVENAATPSEASTSYSDYALASYFVDAKYDFKNRYYLSGSFRYDGSSRFGINNKYAPFWSVGGRYRINSEDFMESTRGWLSNLTLRSSYGTVGNQEIGWYAYQGLFGFGYNYKGNPGMAPTQIANPDLKWETKKKFNIGLDLGFFNNALTIEADWYNELTSDMIFEVPVSYTTGVAIESNSTIASVLKNVGEMKNTGVELLINATPFNRTNFRWNVSLNMTHNKNEIVKLSTSNPIEGTYTIVEPGKSRYFFKMKEYAGVNPENGNPQWYAEDGSLTSDYNKAAFREMGSADPKLFGGITNTFKIYDFDLSFMISFKIGGLLYNSAGRYDENIGNSAFGNTTTWTYENQWRNPGDITTVPKIVYGGLSGASSHSSRFLMDATYAKLRNLQVGYTLPAHLAKKFSLNSVRVYFTGENLYTFLNSELKGRVVDPETGADGILWWNYPVARKFMFGISLGL